MNFVSVRVKPVKSGTRQLQHDTRERSPQYVDQSRSADNVFILGSGVDIERLKALELEQRQAFSAATGRKCRKDGNMFITGVLTFGGEGFQDKTQKNLDQLDARASDFVKALCDKESISPVYLVRHMDEASPHYHFMTTNVRNDLLTSPEHTTFSASLDRTRLSELQDQAGQAFKDIGFNRGIKKVERLKAGEDYSVTVHKSVRHFHSELEPRLRETQEKIQELERVRDEKARQVERLQQEARKLDLTEAQLKTVLDKKAQAEKTLAVYEKRLEKHRAIEKELDKYWIKPEQLKPRKTGFMQRENPSQVAYRLNIEQVKPMLDRIVVLEQENGVLARKIREQELELSKAPKPELVESLKKENAKLQKKLTYYRETPGCIELFNARQEKERQEREQAAQEKERLKALDLEQAKARSKERTVNVDFGFRF